MSDYKIVFIGSPGAGKSTSIRSISDLPPVSTEVPASDESRDTTVALDFGEMTLDDGEVVRLYGVPGQGRFDFIWPLIADGAVQKHEQRLATQMKFRFQLSDEQADEARRMAESGAV